MSGHSLLPPLPGWILMSPRRRDRQHHEGDGDEHVQSRHGEKLGIVQFPGVSRLDRFHQCPRRYVVVAKFIHIY